MVEEKKLKEKLQREIAKKGSIAFSGKVLTKILGFPIKILLARFLGSASLGIFSLGRNIVGWFQQFSLAGLTNGAVKFVSLYKGDNDYENVKGTLISALLIPTMISIVFSVIIFVFSSSIGNFFGKPEVAGALKALSFSLPFLVFTTVASACLKGFKRIDRSTEVRVGKTILNLIILSLVFIVGLRLYGAIIAWIASSITSSILALIFVGKEFPDLFSSLNPSFHLKRLFRFSIPMFFAGFSWILIRRTDVLMLGYFTPSADVGIYSVVFPLTILIAFPQQAISQILAPIISNLHNKGKLSQIKELYKTSTRWAYILSIPALLVLTFFSFGILELLYGPEFRAGGLVLITLAIFEMLNVSLGPTGHTLQMTGNQDVYFIINALSAILNVVLNLLLIPIFGILGAGLATGSTLGINNLLEILVVFKRLRIHPWNKKYFALIPAILLAIIAYLLLNALHVNWMLNLIAVVSIYLFVQYFFGLTEADKKILNTFLDRLIPEINIRKE